MIKALGMVRIADLAGVQYVGHGGDSIACVDAIRRLVVWPDRPKSVLLLSADKVHAFLFRFEREGVVIVKDGFSSGYRGTGPGALADALRLLIAWRVELDEVRVRDDVMGRLGASALTRDDLERIEQTEVVRPERWYDYVYDIYGSKDKQPPVWRSFQPVMPFGLLDQRLTDLALTFFDDPDKALMEGFRRLEDSVRARAGLSEHGVKLFSQAFASDDSALMWKEGAKKVVKAARPIERSEQVGRAQLFTGAYQAFRNPRAHRVLEHDLAVALSEFLVLNQLYLFEAEAVPRPPSGADDSTQP